MHTPQKWTAYPCLCGSKTQNRIQDRIHRTGDRRSQNSQQGIALGYGEEVVRNTTGNRECWLCCESHEAWEQPGSWLQLQRSRTALQRPLITAINLASHWAHVEAETSDSEEGSCRQGFGSTGRQQFVQSYTHYCHIIATLLSHYVTEAILCDWSCCLQVFSWRLVWAVRRRRGFRLGNLFLSKELETKFKTNPQSHSFCITRHVSFPPPSSPSPPPGFCSKLLAEWAFPSVWRAGPAMLLFLMLHLLQKAWDVSAFSHYIHTLLHPAVSQHQMLAGLGVSVSSTVNPCSSTGYISSSE